MKLQRMREVQESVPIKNKRKKKHMRLLRLARFLLPASLFASTVIYGALSPFFNIESIIVTNEPIHQDKQTIIGNSGVVPGANGFRLLFEDPGQFYFFRIGSAERAIMAKCPYVKNAKVRYVPPSQVVIEVKEREATALLYADGTNLLIDGEEILLEVDPDLKELSLPVIKIKRPKELRPGKKLDMQGCDLALAFKVYDAIKQADGRYADKLLPEVDYVDVSEPGKLGFLLQSRVFVNLGNSDDLIYKLDAARVIFEKNIKKDEEGTLDLSSEANPVFSPLNRR